MKYLIYIALFTGIVSGFVIPHAKTVLPLVPYLIGLMLLLNFLEIKIPYKRLIRTELPVTLLLTVVIMPVIAYYVLSVPFHDSYRVGLLLVSLAPSGIIMLIISRFVPEKNYDLIFSNFMVTTFGSIVFIPFVLEIILGKTVRIQTWSLLVQTASLVLVPFLGSRIILMLPGHIVVDRIRKISGWVLVLIVYLVVAASVSSVADIIIWDKTLIGLSCAVFAIFLVQGGIGYVIGFVIGDRSIRHTLALISSSRNVQLMIAVALLNFPPLTVVPLVISILFHHLTNAFWLWLFRK